jgi:hypothetical protein
MSKNPLRKDKTCLNCNYVVENRFCPNCGQENIETRKTFHHLFIHFFEDLTHYENAFWKTIKNLIFKPGSLTNEYISGKRMSYLAPFRLYIFISFVAFLIIAMLPGERSTPTFTKPPKSGVTYSWSKQQQDSIASAAERKEESPAQMFFGDSTMYGSLRNLDSVQKFSKHEDRLSPIEYWFASKAVNVTEHNTKDQIKEKFVESFAHNFPKVLFIYMPIFALVLWLFQSKKKWYYFDHGIFTLHYFSFLLLCQLIFYLVTTFLDLFDGSIIALLIDFLFRFTLFGYMFYYFFPAHYRVYKQSYGTTIFKGILMFIINTILAGLIMTGFIVYTFINIH